MRNFIALICIFLSACGKKTETVTYSNPEKCTVADTPTGAIISCPDGTFATISDGEKGDTGATGPQGPQGPAGSSVTTVKFCQGTPAGNATFPEYGVCIAGKTYAVYWDRSGEWAWLTQLVNGNYTTTTNGANCNFTLNGCSVTH